MKKQSFRHPVWLTVITVLIVITGVFGSIYSKEISKVFPFSLKFYEDSLIPYIFWVLLIGTALLFFFKQKADDEVQKKTIKDLTEIIRTMPPKDFLIKFITSFNEAQEYKLSGLVADKKENIEKYIRSILKVILDLINNFDRADDNIHYGINLMLYEDKSDIDNEKEVLEKMLFGEEGNLINLKGILELRKEFSVNSFTIKEKEIIPDNSIREIVLPIPAKPYVTTTSKILNNILPGAPFAFEMNALSRFADTKEIVDWCEEETNFQPSIINQIRNYFLIENQKNFSAFASVKLPLQNSSVKGVINIHCDKPGLLESDESLRSFYSIALPIITQLNELVEHHSKI